MTSRAFLKNRQEFSVKYPSPAMFSKVTAWVMQYSSLPAMKGFLKGMRDCITIPQGL
jgi:hypothetical protein